MLRRGFLKAGIALALSATFAALPLPCLAATHSADLRDFWNKDRILWLKRSETNEEYRVIFWSNGRVDRDNYLRLCYLLRDASEDQTALIDVNLLNLLYGIQAWAELHTGQLSPIIINSGYRTAGHNAALEGAARNSMHLFGRAADIRLLNVSPQFISHMAKHFGFGGVGLYGNFVHVDTGRKRFWNGHKQHGNRPPRLKLPA